MKYTAKHWNKLLKKVESYFPRRFFSETKRPQQYVHPWTVTMGVDRFNNLTPFFFPGGVNGFPPYVEMEFLKLPEKAMRRVLLDKTIDKNKPIRVYLDEEPTLPLRWRRYSPDEPDVKPPPFQPSPTSEIQATDIIIQTQRISLSVSVVKEVSQDFTGIQVNPTYSQPSGYGFQLASTAKYTPPQSFISAADIVGSRFFDNPFEECKICTIFALRQYGTSPTPNMESWLFATSYDAYYNLLFFAPFSPDQSITNRFSFASALGGGTLQAAVIFGQLFATNDLFSQAYIDFAAKARVRGVYHAI